ncbi:hypothetical protein [Natrinema sp. 74]|uniref:hypothetical protein n=1 Tax=Natrinema sp. 74 TaxID=3384159 RepID=UPI0038D3E2C3
MDLRNWLHCPACSEDNTVSVLAHDTDIVLECYECGHIAEFTVGQDVPFQDLTGDLPEGVADDGRSE